MSKRNYTQYSNKNKKPTEPAESTKPAEAEEKPNVTIPVVDVVVETVSPEKNTVTEPVTTVKGVVVNCARLNVRVEPDAAEEVVCVLDVASEIEIDLQQSTDEWFKVCTVTGAEGYCMRKFIEAHL